MNPEQSHKLVKQTFEADFDRQRFVEFIDKLLKRVNFKKQFMQSGLNIRRAFTDKVNSFERIGQFTDAEDKRIDILIVNLKKDLTLERGRTGLRNFAADYLQSDRGVGKSAVLIAYVSNTQTDWRFSYVTLEKGLRRNETGNFEEEVTKLTPARRYSFLVGKDENSHTAQRQFFELLNHPSPKLQDVEDAFNIEKVTKEFFTEYKGLFEKVRSELDSLCDENSVVQNEFVNRGMFAYAKDENGEELFDGDGNNIRKAFTDDFAKKLLGQIVFLYFLQKKGWFGVERDEKWGTGDRGFLRTLFKKNDVSLNFFDSVLEPLFYNALAIKREYDWSDRFNCKIPFLNGGLFEPLNGYDWVHIELNLPNTLFSNSDISSQGDKGTGILDIFDRYNFTINEAEPLEIEVAVDPEMLGKIFENLLPENIRQGSGTYYTPRVIVAYMCQQSLINYLSSHLNEVSYADLETFIRFGSQRRDYTEAGTQSQIEKFLPQSVIDNALNIDGRLKQITVCDPAVGSGAFPVGMMLEIVKAREALRAVQGVDRVSQYDLKRETIENSIFGVDIDLGAVEIAKLRLWLSLIVDESDFETIEPLPNLDYKIMQGNSLLDTFHGVKLVDEDLFQARGTDKELRLQEIESEIAGLTKELTASNVGKQSPLYVLTGKRITELKKQKIALASNEIETVQSGLFTPVDELHQKLESLRRRHKDIFDETRRDVKEKLRIDAEKLEWEFVEAKLKADGNSNELSELASHRYDRKKDYFIWQLNFPEIFQLGGFDIVIGNPPYLRIQGIRDSNPQLADNLTRLYKSATGSFDLYVTFVERGLTLSKSSGVVNYIMPVKWTNAAFGSGLRHLIAQSKSCYQIISFGAYQVFNASTYTGLQWFKRESDNLRYFELDRELKSNEELGGYLNSLTSEHAVLIPSGKLTKDTWILAVGKTATILDKLHRQPRRLSDIFQSIFQGLATSKDDVYFLYDCVVGKDYVEGFSKHLGSRVELERAFTKPLLKGNDVHRYESIKTNRVVIFPYEIDAGTATLYSENEIEKRFPLAYRYLKDCEPTLRAREKGRFNIDGEWFQFGRKQGITFAETEKLVAPEISLGGNFSYDEKGEFYSTTKIYGYIKKDSADESYLFLLGLLNSSLFWFFIQQTGYVLRGGYYTFKTNYILPFPIPEKIPQIIARNVERRVGEILEVKKHSPHKDTSQLENEIDRIIFDLYELSLDEQQELESG